MRFIRVFDRVQADQEDLTAVLELSLKLSPVGAVRISPGFPRVDALDCAPPKRVHGCDGPTPEDSSR